MDERAVNCQKLNLDKKFKCAWIVIAAIFALITVMGLIQYGNYKDAQKAAVDFTLAETDRFDEYKDNYIDLVNQMHNFYAPTPTKTVINGVMVDNSDVVNAAKVAEAALEDKMFAAGYRQYIDTECFQYTSLFDFVFYKVGSTYILWFVLVIVLLLITLWYSAEKKNTIAVNGDKIICKKGEVVVKEFLIRDIKKIQPTFGKGLIIHGNGIKVKINLLENANEIKTVIMNSTAFLPVEKPVVVPKETTIIQQTSNADELKKYKELLDSGVITQEEFDAKKKQLLGL